MDVPNDLEKKIINSAIQYQPEKEWQITSDDLRDTLTSIGVDKSRVNYFLAQLFGVKILPQKSLEYAKLKEEGLNLFREYLISIFDSVRRIGKYELTLNSDKEFEFAGIKDFFDFEIRYHPNGYGDQQDIRRVSISCKSRNQHRYGISSGLVWTVNSHGRALRDDNGNYYCITPYALFECVLDEKIPKQNKFLNKIIKNSHKPSLRIRFYADEYMMNGEPNENVTIREHASSYVGSEVEFLHALRLKRDSMLGYRLIEQKLNEIPELLARYMDTEITYLSDFIKA